VGDHQSLGEAFGVGIGGVLFQNQWNTNVNKQILSGSLPGEYIISIEHAEQAAEIIKDFPVPIQRIYRIIMAQAIDSLFILLASLSAFAFVVSLMSRNLSMSRESKSPQEFGERVRGNSS